MARGMVLEVDALKDLAVQVIRQAVKDVIKGGKTAIKAQQFLDSKDLEPWAGILNIDPDAIRYNTAKSVKKRKERRVGVVA